MKKITIEFNPFEKEVNIKHNNTEWNKNDNKYFSGYDFESALTGIIEVILNEICIDGDNELEIEFIGRKIEYLMLKDALNKVSQIKANIKHQIKYDLSVSEIIKKIEKLDEKFFKRKHELLKKLKSNPEIFVIGNYSTGKSTFLNSVLRNDILYTDTDVATNKLLYIINDEKEQLFVLDGKKWKQETFKNVSELKEKIKQLNDNMMISKIKLHYPLESFKGMQLRFIDTPGVNNAIDEEHRRLAFDAINDEVNYPLVLIFVDAQNYQSTDYANFFEKITQKLNSDKNLERFIFIVNKADTAKDIKKSSESVKKYLFNKFGNNKLKIFFTDSLLAQALYKKEKGEELNDEEIMKLAAYTALRENGREKFLPEYSTVYELFNVDRDNLIEHSGVPFVEKYIKNYLINSFEKEKIEDAEKELERVKKEFNERVLEKRKEIENIQQEINELKEKLTNKDFSSIFKSLQKEINKREKELKELNKKIKKFEENLQEVEERIKKLDLDTSKINEIQGEWGKEIQKIKKTDIITKLNSLNLGYFDEKDIKKRIKALFNTTSDFKCSENKKREVFEKLNKAVDEELDEFEKRYSEFKNNFEKIKKYKKEADEKFLKKMNKIFSKLKKVKTADELRKKLIELQNRNFLDKFLDFFTKEEKILNSTSTISLIIAFDNNFKIFFKKDEKMENILKEEFFKLAAEIKKDIYENFWKSTKMYLGVSNPYTTYYEMEKLEEDIERFVNSAIDALQEERDKVIALRHKAIVKEGKIFSGIYCQVDVLREKIDYMIDKDKGIYKYYYLLKRLPELSIELASEFEAKFKKNILQEAENIQKEMTQLIENSEFSKLEKINLQTINLKGFDKFKNIFIYRDSLEESKNTLFNLNLTPGKEWMSHTAKYINEDELEKINTSYRKELAQLENDVKKKIEEIKEALMRNINNLREELVRLEQEKENKIKEIKNTQNEYEKEKNNEQKELKVKKEISKKENKIKELEKEIKTYEQFIKQLTLKDI